MRIGIDLGGTKIEGVVLGADGDILLRRRIATPQGDYLATLSTLCELVEGLERSVGSPCTVGLSTPGAVDSDGRMKNCNSTCLNGERLKEDLEGRLGREVRLANDADCMVLSEATDGAAAAASVVFGVILGTGVGGGFVIHGRLLQGPDSIAGEWGHNPLPWPQDGSEAGTDCYCGLTGCIESHLSGPALERRAGGLPAAVVGLRDASDTAAIMDQYCERLARALASVINVVDPDVIVLAGGVSNIGYIYERVPQLWAKWVFTDKPCTRLVKAMHGDSSGVRGAAWLWN